jgi:glycyl-tRNA synthetase
MEVKKLPDMETLVSLAKRRGFVFPGSEIYGGLALGVELRNNIKNLWWNRFVRQRHDVVGLEAALIMNSKVWEASGHTATFSDPLVECRKCNGRFRADNIGEPDGEGWKLPACPNCGKEDWTEARQFNLMLKTFLGPAEEAANVAYLRPETAQGMFVDFKNVVDSSRVRLPFGIAQVGKAFRNEITPGNYIFRTREFEQMEIEYFIKPPVADADWELAFESWRKAMHEWVELIGIDAKNVHELEVAKDELAHYSKRTIDLEYDFPFGRKELYGLAYRTDFDLKNHFAEAPYRDPETGETYHPHVIEPTWGVDRTMLAVLCDAYREVGDGDKKRVYLALKPYLAPYRAAVFPLLANKPELVTFAKSLYGTLLAKFPVAWDDRGNVGKRYFAQDEIGTPWCITVDFQTLEDGTVTLRDRDTGEQKRVASADLPAMLEELSAVPAAPVL